MSLIIKPGGSFTHKSGASFGVKGSGLPPYVIDGLEQSHWDVANAVVDGSSKITSIPDSSNVQSLTLVTAADVPNPVKATYSATGWQLNGKTLPVALMRQGNENLRQWCVYQANDWGPKLNNYSGAMTVAALVKPMFSLQQPGRKLWSWTNTSQFNYMFGPSRNSITGKYSFQRSVNDPFRFESGTAQEAYQIVMVEYRNDTTFAAPSNTTALGSFKVWVNGSIQTNTSGEWVWGSGLSARTIPLFSGITSFQVGGGGAASNWPEGFSCDLAQMHIWKGALTTEQRDSVTAYLKSISGIA